MASKRRRLPKPANVAARPRSESEKTKPAKLQHLTTAPVTEEEMDALFNSFFGSTHPIVVAILGQALIEHELDRHIRRKLKHRDNDTWEHLTAESGPISTFARKIALGHALGIYDKRMKDDLDIIRKIRNVFAHAKRMVKFENPAIRKELRKIVVSRDKSHRSIRDGSASGMHTFVYLCSSRATKLKQIDLDYLRGKVRRIEKKNARRDVKPSRIMALLGNPFAAAWSDISSSPPTPEESIVNALARRLAHQTESPSPPARQGALASLKPKDRQGGGGDEG